MKTILMTLLLSTTAMAADFSYPKPPIRPFTINEQKMNVLDSYATVTSGSTFNQSYTFGGNIGTRIYGPLFGEASYDYINRNHKVDNRIVGNAVLMQPLTYGTVYGLIGAGYTTRVDKWVWNVGVGYRLPVVSNVDLDVRYRYVSRFDNRKMNDNVLTVGVVYKF
jgi:opacity protein-like surface antigen